MYLVAQNGSYTGSLGPKYMLHTPVPFRQAMMRAVTALCFVRTGLGDKNDGTGLGGTYIYIYVYMYTYRYDHQVLGPF